MAIPFLKRALQEPSYGWERNGELYVPTAREIRREWFGRMNLFADRKAWLSVTVWGFMFALFPFGVVFLTRFFSWQLTLAGSGAALHHRLPEHARLYTALAGNALVLGLAVRMALSA